MSEPQQHSDLILVVEDDQPLLKLIQRRLGEHGFQTEGVTSGTAALGWLKDRSPSLMLLDYSLPDMLGEELLEQLDAQGIQVPFVVATGHGSETVAVEMMKRGARDYLIKGAAFMKLLPTVIDQALARLKQAERLVRAEAALRSAHDALEQLRRRQAELAHVDRVNAMGEMAAGLVHELNQPLTAISNHVQVCLHMLQSDPESRCQRLSSSLSQIDEQVNRAAEITRRLRRYGTKTVPDRTVLDVNALVRDVAALVEIEARQEQVDVRMELTEPIPPVAVDRIQIEQVLVNLVRNALDAMRDLPPEARVLTIRTSAGRDHIEVAVDDRGIGVPAEELDRVFDRFYTTKADGMGMGLAISRSIVDSHGGRMSVAPNPGGGTTFQFDLPIDVP